MDPIDGADIYISITKPKNTQTGKGSQETQRRTKSVGAEVVHASTDD